MELDESERIRGDSAMADKTQTDPRKSGQNLTYLLQPSQGEASIPQVSAPASTGCLLPYSDAQEYELREEFSFGPHKDLVRLLVQGARTQTSLVVDIKHHRCVVGAHHHMAISQVWCAMWDGDPSTDRGQGGHIWPLPNRWETRPSLALSCDKELPAPGPNTKTRFPPHV